MMSEKKYDGSEWRKGKWEWRKDMATLKKKKLKEMQIPISRNLNDHRFYLLA